MNSEWDEEPTQPEAYVSIREVKEGYDQFIYLPRRWREIDADEERESE